MSIFTINLSAQVGIQTQAPQGIFHIDAATNNDNAVPTTKEQIIDDIVVSKEGFVGVGEINPNQKLTINGKIKITDGTQGNGKLLVSDKDGKASWRGDVSIKGKYAGWRLEGTDLNRTTPNNDTISLKGTSSIEDNSNIGLQMITNGVHVPHGKYFIVMNGDISSSTEYCLILVDLDGKKLTYAAYAEWLSGYTFFLEVENQAGSDVTLRWINRPLGNQTYYQDFTGQSRNWWYSLDFHMMGNMIF
jgi:hypothetical protein